MKYVNSRSDCWVKYDYFDYYYYYQELERKRREWEMEVRKMQDEFFGLRADDHVDSGKGKVKEKRIRVQTSGGPAVNIEVTDPSVYRVKFDLKGYSMDNIDVKVRACAWVRCSTFTLSYLLFNILSFLLMVDHHAYLKLQKSKLQQKQSKRKTESTLIISVISVDSVFRLTADWQSLDTPA